MHLPRTSLALLGPVLACALGAVLAVGTSAASAHEDGDPDVYVVTLTGGGTAASQGSEASRSAVAASMIDRQRRLLASVDAPFPLYSWTHTLNGFAVRLDVEQVADLSDDPRVESIQADERHRVAAHSQRAAAPIPTSAGRQDGAGVVIGFVDTGIAPDAASFADTPGRRKPQEFGGRCTGDPVCGGKVVTAETFVAGFGTADDHLSASAALSPVDTDGHGTRLASIAAGNAGVTVRVDGQRRGTASGVAPGASVASYKACWNGPEPALDGCATSDVVAAVDAAVRDGVDVLVLGLAGPQTIDALGRALLGATEAGVVVVAPAGNSAEVPASHPAPWVVTVGASAGSTPRGRLELGDRGVSGVMTSATGVESARIVTGLSAAAPRAPERRARRCAPGSLDASRVVGAIVLCERGGGSLVDKSLTVERADGVGMVLANTSGGSARADLHAVPTLHVTRPAADRLRTWLEDTPAVRASLRAVPSARDERSRVLGYSASGDPRAPTIKPDVVAPGTGTLAVAAVDEGNRWDYVAGTSVSAARVAGLAATLLAEGATPAAVRSSLVTTAQAVPGAAPTRAGAGVVDPEAAARSRLRIGPSVSSYRAWIEGRSVGLNTPSVSVRPGRAAVRRLTNTGGDTLVLTAQPEGFRGEVRVVPSTLSIPPGATRSVRIRAVVPRVGIDQGRIVWQGADQRHAMVVVVRE